ncbi:MAG TPA: YoaK family protein [Kribbellaceae bacterium]|nr:YoaK family protein [Kribbellaceae bacterium]
MTLHSPAGPHADREHGPLPAFLVCLTVVTGLVDAFSYLSLGHVFVANMTGNVVFLGFGLAGVGEISITASLLAVLAFAVGAMAGGRWAAQRELHRGHLLATATSIQAGLVLAASVIASAAGTHGSAVRLMLTGLLALAMGGQNAVVRRLAVPDLTTTVLTLTVTGLVADTTPRSVRTRRLFSVLAMLAGALTGGVLLRWIGLATPLWTAAALLTACAAGTYAATTRPQSRAWR